MFEPPPAARARAAAQRMPQRPAGLVPGFGFYLRQTVANGVHSGAGRTAADDDDSDYYPVALKQETLRPGTIYADPYGHVLVISKRIAQSDAGAGVFLAVDGQPDGTVARKRFWRGNFLFAQDPGLGGPGFKRFRPIVAGKSGLRRLTNEEIAKDPRLRRFLARAEQTRHRGLLRSHGRRDVAGAARSPARHEGGNHLARGTGEHARHVGGERAQVPDRRRRRGGDARWPVNLRDDRCLGGLRHALARSAPADRHRRGARLPGARRPSPRTLRDAGGQEHRRREGRDGRRARHGAGGAQVLLYAHGRFRRGRWR